MNRHLVSPRFAVVGIVLAVVVAVAMVLARRYRSLEVEWGSSRGSTAEALSNLHEGMTLEEVTSYLQQRGIAFRVDSGDDGPLVAGIDRKSTVAGQVTQTSEQQIEFDARRRLRGLRTWSTISSR